MSTDYLIVCFTCKKLGPIFASSSIAYGYKVWNDDDVPEWLGHRQAVGAHENHDLRIINGNTDLPWEDEADGG